MITDDFRLSILFSTGDKAAEFEGDRAGLEVYLAQREVSVLTHHLLQGAVVDDTELVLSEMAGAFESCLQRERPTVGGQREGATPADLPQPVGPVHRLGMTRRWTPSVLDWVLLGCTSAHTDAECGRPDSCRGSTAEADPRWRRRSLRRRSGVRSRPS